MTSLACAAVRVSRISQKTGTVFKCGGSLLGLRQLSGNLPCRSAKTNSTEEPINLDEDKNEENDRIAAIRNISRLRPRDRNIVNGTLNSDEKTMPPHFTVRYNKRLFGKYGYASGVNPGICWPTKQELADKKEYEQVAYPYSILEVAEREAAAREEKERKRWERDEEVAANIPKMLKMKEEYYQRLKKREEEAAAAKAFKTRLIEEVRLHFNYTITERDERFALELKERAKQLREKERLARKAVKKEKAATMAAEKFEFEKKKTDGGRGSKSCK